jgi:hypothetical protein
VARRGTSREEQKNQDRPICLFTDMSLGRNTRRVEIISEDEVYYANAQAFFLRFVAPATGRNGDKLRGGRQACQKIPGLMLQKGSIVPWRFNLDTFLKQAPDTQRVLLRLACRPNSPIIAKL